MVDGERIDMRDKVTGRARYLDDLPLRPGTLHAYPLGSPYSHARIVSIDSSAALAMPGVRGVLDREHLDGLDPRTPFTQYLAASHGRPTEWAGTEEGVLATDRVRFDGEMVAMVVADDLATAREATKRIDVRYEVLPTVFSFAEAMRPGAPLLHEGPGSNLAYEDGFEWGDVEDGLRRSDIVVEGTFYGGNAYHHPMEPATSCLVSVVGDEVDLWVSVARPFIVAPVAFEWFLGVPNEKVRVRTPEIGGGFGAKEVNAQIMAAAALSQRTGRPVKYLATEHESFRTTARHAAEYRAKLGMRADGTLQALDVELDLDTGAYYTGAAVVAHNACISAWGCYRWPSFRAQARSAYTNKVPAASFRGTGKHQTTFGVESIVDEAARRIGMDPIAFRTKNALTRGERVGTTWKVRGEECIADTPPMDTDFAELMRIAADRIGWDGRVSAAPPAPGSRVARGRGIGLSLRHGSQGGGRASAMVILDEQGRVAVHHNAPDLGSGVYNMLSVVASRSLGVPQAMVKVHLPDSANRLRFGGTSAQRTTVQIGNAVRAACESLKGEIVAAAAQVRGGAPADWHVEGGRVWRDQTSYSYAEILGGYAEESVKLSAMGSYSYRPTLDKAYGGLDHWAPAATAAEVEVDLDTGDMRVLQLAVVADAGRAIHAESAAGQVAGGAVLGLGVTLFEDLVYEDGQLLNADPFQYRLPLMSDMPPHFETALVENGDGPGPFGSKGISQTSTVCVAGAVGNAIRDAIGVRLTVTPFTPERILTAIGRLRTEG